MQSEQVRLGRWGIINPFLLRVPGGEAKDRARSSVGVLPVPITARASREWNEGKAMLRGSDLPAQGMVGPASILTH